MASFIKDWTQKEFDALTTSFKRYRIFVFILRFSLPIAAAAILFLIVFYAESEDKSAKIVVENIAVKALPTDEITSIGVMENPRFQGVDASNQPYSLKAEQAWQKNSNEVEMRNITADITTSNGNWISAIAGEALYFLAENVTNLKGGVEVFITGDNNVVNIQTGSAKLDIKNSIISGESAVTVKSDMANFAASGFVAKRDEQKISFTGPIKLVIVP